MQHNLLYDIFVQLSPLGLPGGVKSAEEEKEQVNVLINESGDKSCDKK